MVNIIVSGLPENTRVPHLIFVFKTAMKNAGVKKFWITEMSYVPGTTSKSVTMEFYSSGDAHKAHRVLDGFVYRNSGKPCILAARIEDWGPSERSPSPVRVRERRQDRYESDRGHDRYSRPRPRERERSRSPHLSHEASKLDLEIELLRKQRMIIEEERRLVLERKKLELVKEYGPDAITDFDRRDDRERRPRADRERRPEPYRPRRRSPPPPRVRDRLGPQRAKLNKKPPDLSAYLPNFFTPCKFLVNDMKTYFQHVEGKENFLLLKVLRTAVRKRLVLILEDKPRMSTKEILVLYREFHPKETDEALVKKLLSDVRACQETKGSSGSKKEVTKTTVTENKVENGKDDKNDNGGTGGNVSVVKSEADEAGNENSVVKKEDNKTKDATEKDNKIKDTTEIDAKGGEVKKELNKIDANIEVKDENNKEDNDTVENVTDTILIGTEDMKVLDEVFAATDEEDKILKSPDAAALEADATSAVDNDDAEEWVVEGEEWTAEPETAEQGEANVPKEE